MKLPIYMQIDQDDGMVGRRWSFGRVLWYEKRCLYQLTQTPKTPKIEKKKKIQWNWRRISLKMENIVEKMFTKPVWP